jgi:GLPGLI family protein
MKKILILSALVFLLISSTNLLAQKILTEGTVVYNIDINTTTETGTKPLSTVTSTVLVKNNLTRSEMVSSVGNEITIHDAKLGSAIVLKEYSGQKLMITLTKENWEFKNKAYNDINFTLTDETKNIAGIECKKATAVLGNGNSFVVFYNPAIVMGNKLYNVTFKNLPGLAMQYTFEQGKTTFTYTAASVNFDPVPASKFDTPKAGYRVMTYDQNQQIKKGDQ